MREPKNYWKQDKPRYEITWKSITNGKIVKKKTFTWKKAIGIALDARHGTLLENAVTDKVSIIDTESGEETII